jgi:hypothetical protein
MNCLSWPLAEVMFVPLIAEQNANELNINIIINWVIDNKWLALLLLIIALLVEINLFKNLFIFCVSYNLSFQ